MTDFQRLWPVCLGEAVRRFVVRHCAHGALYLTRDEVLLMDREEVF